MHKTTLAGKNKHKLVQIRQNRTIFSRPLLPTPSVKKDGKEKLIERHSGSRCKDEPKRNKVCACEDCFNRRDRQTKKNEKERRDFHNNNEKSTHRVAGIGEDPVRGSHLLPPEAGLLLLVIAELRARADQNCESGKSGGGVNEKNKGKGERREKKEERREKREERREKKEE